MRIYRFLLISLSTLTLGMFVTSRVSAQAPALEIVATYTIEGEQGIVGDIVSRKLPENTLKLAERNAEEVIMGVIIPEDLAVAAYRGGENQQLVAQRGTFPVNVTTITGDIFPGDFITSSPLLGKGQRAGTISENILGMAVEEFDASKGTPQQIPGPEGDLIEIYSGTIMVDLNARPNTQNLGAFKEVLDLARRFGINIFSQFQTSEGASLFVRYLMATMITILTVYFAFKHFGRSILRGIEAIGRNPLAKGSIQSAIIVNAIIIVLVSISVVILSLLIIRL